MLRHLLSARLWFGAGNTDSAEGAQLRLERGGVKLHTQGEQALATGSRDSKCLSFLGLGEICIFFLMRVSSWQRAHHRPSRIDLA